MNCYLQQPLARVILALIGFASAACLFDGAHAYGDYGIWERYVGNRDNSYGLRPLPSDYNARRKASQDSARRADAAKLRAQRARKVQAEAARQFKPSRNPSPLHVAASLNDVKTLGALLTKTNVNERDPANGWSPLHYAIYFGAVDAARLLIRSGAVVNMTTGVGEYRPIHFAVRSGDAELTTMLVFQGADVNVFDHDKVTPLHVAALQLDESLVNLLLGNGAVANVKTIDEITPLDWAGDTLHENATSSQKTDTEKLRAYEGVKRLLLAFGAPNGDSGAELKRSVLAQAKADHLTYDGIKLLQSLDGKRSESVEKEMLAKFTEAASLGSPVAMNCLGVLRTEGLGLSKDEKEALAWWRKSADLGDGQGMFNVATCYDEGHGTVKDVQLALEWFKKAAAAGNKQAAEFLSSKTTAPSALPVATTGGKVAPQDAIIFQSRAYKVIKESLPWREAKRASESMGGHLVTISSQAEQDFVLSLLKPAGVEPKWDIWIGLIDEAGNGQWQFVDGKPLTYTAWAKGSPNEPGAARAVHLYGRKGMAWADTKGLQQKFWFVCEWDQQPIPAVNAGGGSVENRFTPVADPKSDQKNSAGPSIAPKDVLVTPQPASSKTEVTSAEILAFREAQLRQIRDQIKKLQSMVASLPKNRTSPSAIEEKLEFAKATEAKILAKSDASIAQEIAAAKAKALADEAQALADAEAQKLAAEKEKQIRQQELQARRAAAEASAEEAKRRRAAVLARRFPGWNGPWKTCPICHGTGRDTDKEREINMRNASIIASQSIGAGVTRQIPGAHVDCGFCGGTCVIPDQR